MTNTLDLQLFADDAQSMGVDATEAPGSAGEKADERPDATSDTASEQKPKKEAKYTDADVDEILNKKFAKWQERQKAAVDEARKYAEMNAQQKAEYERDQLKKELETLKQAAALADMKTEARKMLTANGITIGDELLSAIVTADAEKTKANIDGFSKMFNEAVESAVKERLRGEPPRKGSGGATAMTKAQIMAIRDPELRQKKMLEYRHQFNF